MSEPRSDYNAAYPTDLYKGNLQQERAESGRLVVNARDYNIHDKEIRALQAYLGIASPAFDPAGPSGSTGATIVDRLISIAGTASCWEDGTICDYSNPNGIDPSGFVISTTAIITRWVDPTGVPAVPDTPPIPTIVGNPWPGPGGPGIPGNPVPVPGGQGGAPPYPGGSFDGISWSPPPGLLGGAAFDSDHPNSYGVTDFLRWVMWAIGTNFTRHKWNSAETINFQPAPYADLRNIWKTVVDLFNGWPSSRTNPSTAAVASIFDVILPLVTLAEFALDTFNIKVVVVTANGTTLTSFSTPNGMNGGKANGAVPPIAVLTNRNDSLGLRSQITRVETSPGAVDISGTLSAVTTHRIVWGGGNEPLVNTQLAIVYFASGLPNFITDGARETQKVETITMVGDAGTLSSTPADGVNSQPLLIVHGITAGGVSTVLKYVTSGLTTGEFTISGAVITKFSGDAFVELVAHYQVNNT